MPKRTLLLILALIIVTGLLLEIALSQKNNLTNPGKLSTPTPTATNQAHTMLSLVSNTSSASASVDVNVDSGGDNLTAAEIELSYDPKMLSQVVITPGTYFTNPVIFINKVDTKNGKILYAIAIPPSGTPQKGQGKLARIYFLSNVQSGQQTEIKFLPTTIVTAKRVRESVLKSAIGTTILSSL